MSHATSTSPQPRVWLITGSSTGLGRSLAEAVLAAGERLVATARNVSALDGLAELADTDRLLAVQLDVTDQAQVDAAFAQAVARFGRVDVVRPTIFFGVGLRRGGGFHNACVERWATECTLAAVATLTDSESQGHAAYCEGTDLFVHKDPIGEHTEETWQRWLPYALRLFYGPRS
ncbi:oxidoreductase, short chain dehydrogenase/reductase superfamily protein [Acanthamoeba castellanii str. Neff]|uniref:Oxidoreductase, short chain dehydrogenase/reductase superfamily protein n=1 Tax=Acanthamoeba castellanii (strain ATCC 30010 / Neff) TaxID=1257118 RepID=L8HC28_ACACF|nr:oxidoreductase, short chain dehydrogenase/reductase superfamily protein [Acanthamoeba castellanii str. Neff]ELR22298.1 oxidoreductase, short chain dehydrogenase/reductase superfamily protein [Acanthamoeba castellanii str. Neff]